MTHTWLKAVEAVQRPQGDQGHTQKIWSLASLTKVKSLFFKTPFQS